MAENDLIVARTKEHFLDLYNKSGMTAPYPEHVATVERLASNMLKEFPEADKLILMLAVWLHDIGTFLGDRDVHEINSEKEANRYLPILEVGDEIIKKVAHCVRSHRCNNSKPESIEAKMLAVADSASHLIDGPYINMIKKYGKKYVIDKLERDYRDVELLPNTKKEFTPLYRAWRNLLETLPE